MSDTAITALSSIISAIIGAMATIISANLGKGSTFSGRALLTGMLIGAMIGAVIGLFISPVINPAPTPISPPAVTTSTPTAIATLPPPSASSAPSTIPVATLPPVSQQCSWLPYLNGTPAPALNDQSCLNDPSLLPYGISESGQQVKFNVIQNIHGMYGVCEQINNISDIKLQLSIGEDFAASRYLLSIAPGPAPDKSSYALRFQPQNQGARLDQPGIAIKELVFNTNNFPNEVDGMLASLDWENLRLWKFDVTFQLSHTTLTPEVYGIVFTKEQLGFSHPYLCLVYEALSTAQQSTQLNVTVQFSQ